MERQPKDASPPGVGAGHVWDRAARLFGALNSAGRDHVSPWDMLDYAIGGLDRQIMEALYGGHIKECQACVNGLHIAERSRPADLTTLDQVPEFVGLECRDLSYELEDGSAQQHLADFISSERGPFLIVGGEANPYVYGTLLADCLRRRASDGERYGWGKPRVVCGPAMALLPGVSEGDGPVLPDLAEEGIIDLYASHRRQPVHFRVSGDHAVTTESYHKAGDLRARRGKLYRGAPIAALFRRRFEAIIRAGLAKRAGREDFVYLTMDQILEIQKVSDIAYDSLTAEQLRGLLPKLRP